MGLPRLNRGVARAVGAVGRSLIFAGVVLLLFVAYQLWGTGLQHARAQDRLTGEFSTLLEQVDQQPSTTTTAPTTTTEATTTTEGPTTTTTIDPDLLAMLAPEAGDPVARIVMPTIGVDQIVVSGVGVADLKLGPGHFPWTPLPGQPGNASIAGHRTTYGQPFHDLDLLQPGDPIVVETLQGSFTYRVMPHADAEGAEVGYFIVPPTAVEVLDDVGDNRLTLSACHPKFSSRQRIIVTALLEEDIEPAAPTPIPDPVEPELPGEDDTADDTADDGAPDDDPGPDPADEGFGEGLEGDPEALGPATVWGALALGVVLSAWLLGQRWRRWPVYLGATPVFLVVLFVCFFHLDRLLPAY